VIDALYYSGLAVLTTIIVTQAVISHNQRLLIDALQEALADGRKARTPVKRREINLGD
jgi:hypothetical protein